MNEPDRLADATDNEVERLLLRAGRDEAPRGAQGRALLAASGVLAASTLSAGNATAAVAAGKAIAGAKVASLLPVKWIMIIGLASVGAVAGSVAVRVVRGRAATHSHEPATTANGDQARPVATRHPATEPRLTAAPPSNVPISAASTSSAPAPPLLPTSRTPIALTRETPRPMRPATEIPTGRSTAAAELALLDVARSEVADGDAPQALSTLEDYPRRFPNGVLAPEAAVLRIEALVAAGDHSAAARAAESFLRANPASPYAKRIESLVATSNP